MKVKFVPQNVEFEIKPNESVMHVAQDHGIYIKSVCKGVPSCAECRVRLVEGEHNVLPPGSEELSLIGTGHFIDRRRLSCQLKCFGDITVDMTEQIAKEQGLIVGRKKKMAIKDDRVEQAVVRRSEDAPDSDEGESVEGEGGDRAASGGGAREERGGRDHERGGQRGDRGPRGGGSRDGGGGPRENRSGGRDGRQQSAGGSRDGGPREGRGGGNRDGQRNAEGRGGERGNQNRGGQPNQQGGPQNRPGGPNQHSQRPQGPRAEGPEGQANPQQAGAPGEPREGGGKRRRRRRGKGGGGHSSGGAPGGGDGNSSGGGNPGAPAGD